MEEVIIPTIGMEISQSREPKIPWFGTLAAFQLAGFNISPHQLDNQDNKRIGSTILHKMQPSSLYSDFHSVMLGSISRHEMNAELLSLWPYGHRDIGRPHYRRMELSDCGTLFLIVRSLASIGR